MRQDTINNGDRRFEKKSYSLVGRIAFIVGLVLVIIIALFSASAIPEWAIFVVAILGIIVGLMNITEHEVNSFLIASIALLLSFQSLSAIMRELAFGWDAVPAFFGLLVVFIAPAAAIVAIKALFTVTRS